MNSKPRCARPSNLPSNSLAQEMNVLQRPFDSLSSKFALGDELGRGISGIVRKCREISTGRKFACKSINKTIFVTEEDVKALRSEIAAMEWMRGCREATFLRCSMEDEQSVHLVMELCEGDDLATKLEREERISEKESAHIVFSLASAIMYCHKMGIVHCDLKPENVLFCSKYPFSEIRLSDFGVAKFLNHGEKLKDIVGSPYYIAPEMLRGCYSREVDVWSLGVILYTMLSGQLPFFHRTCKGVFKEILAAKINLDTPSWECVSSSAKNLIFQLLNPNSSRRITIPEILSHPWILEHKAPLNSKRLLCVEDYENEDEDGTSIPIAESLSYDFDDLYPAEVVE